MEWSSFGLIWGNISDYNWFESRETEESIFRPSFWLTASRIQDQHFIPSGSLLGMG